jgi:hypothetical protein
VYLPERDTPAIELADITIAAIAAIICFIFSPLGFNYYL